MVFIILRLFSLILSQKKKIGNDTHELNGNK